MIATTSGDNRGSFRLRVSPDQNPRLKPFDGHSDDSLRTTWDPGQPYGDALLQSATPNP